MLLKNQRLKRALKKNDTETAKLCIKDGAMPPHKWLSKFLYLNIKNNNLTPIKACIEAGIDTETITGTEYQETILHVAARFKRLELVEYLISKSAKVDSFDKDGVSILFDVCDEENSNASKIIELLIKHGASINCQTPTKKRTALMRAAMNSRTRLSKTLIELGADLTLIDSDNKTAWDLSTTHTRPLFPEYKLQQHQEAERKKMTVAEKAAGLWEPAFNKSIAFVQTARNIQKELTEIFNFSALEVTIILRNTETNVEHCSKEKFIEYADKDRLTTACSEYNKTPDIIETINPDSFTQVKAKVIDGKISTKMPLKINS